MSECKPDPEMLLLGHPMLAFADAGGWFSPNSLPAAVQVVIEKETRGWAAHVWFYRGNGGGESVRFFTKKKPAKTPLEALAVINGALGLIRAALNTPPPAITESQERPVQQ